MKRVLLAFVIACAASQVHATTVALSPVGHQQFTSLATGAPLASGCIYTYAGGTTTFLATYTDSTGATQNTDPIQLDSGGGANIWLTGSAYKFGVYANPTGGACPGTPGGSLVLQYTVDNITTSTGSGSGAATSVVSAGANPASSGIIEMTKSDTICWRNAANSGNVCLSKDSNDLLTWSQGSLNFPEVGTPAGTAVGNDTLWADSAAHRFKMVNNGGAADVFAGAATTDILTNKTYDTGGAGNVFKIAGTQVTGVGGACAANQFGTNTAIASGSIGLSCTQPSAANLSNGITGTGAVVLATSPALTTPTIGGVTVTTPVNLIASGTVSMPTSLLAANGGCATASATATGATSSDSVEWNISGTTFQTLLVYQAGVTTNQVTFQQCNFSGAGVTPGAETINWRVIR